jgi:hypothetical protein
MRKLAGRQWRGPKPATVVAVIALIAATTGTAVAARDAIKLPKNSVGAPQLKKKAVTLGKVGNNAVSEPNVIDKSLTGAEFRLQTLVNIPAALDASHAGNADTVAGHPANCPGGTTLIRGVCFDSSPNGLASSLQEAADGCAAKGGWLPTPAELFSAKGILNLGTGVGTDEQFTDSVYADDGAPPAQPNKWTMTIDGKGTLERHELDQPSHYFCVYPLVR